MDPEAGEVRPRPGELRILPGDVLALARCGGGRRWQTSVERAIDEARSLVEPRARWSPLPKHAPDLFGAETPVRTIASRGDAWVFAATIGTGIEESVRERFARGEFLRGLLLDAAGSAAVEALCDRVESACAGGSASARFSPGYCMWGLERQRVLFELVGPDSLGIRLLPSMLMHPLKSVSGLVVRGRPEDLVVPPDACRQCGAAGCTRRSRLPGVQA